MKGEKKTCACKILQGSYSSQLSADTTSNGHINALPSTHFQQFPSRTDTEVYIISACHSSKQALEEIYNRLKHMEPLWTTAFIIIYSAYQNRFNFFFPLNILSGIN